jgi:flagellar basal-body rod protein FlgC
MSGIDSTSSALNAERLRLDIISENIANANTTKGPDGKPYQRQQVVFESLLKTASQDQNAGSPTVSLRVARVEKDQRPPRMVYDPGHPEANAQGMVAMPDINVPEEMVDMIASSRTYEANLAVVKNARTMAMQALAIAKHS